MLPQILMAQHHASCPVDQHLASVYENPLFEAYLSKYDVKFYHLSLEVNNKNSVIDGFTEINSVALESMDTIVFQLIDELSISLIEVGGTQVEGFVRRDDAVYIPVSANNGDFVSVRIYYNGEASQDRGFFAGMSSTYDRNNDQWITYTLSEPLNARDWFPVKQVLPDKADSVWVDLTCDTTLMAGSNGLLQEIEDLGNGKHTFKWRSTYPIAYYLISLAVADYRDYSFNAPLSTPGDSVLVQNFIYDDDSYFARWKESIDRTADMIELFSKKVIDYPFAEEKYGHAVAPMGGGMEHQTMTTLSSFGFTLVAHELAHQWFGDNITCGTWQDIWINEGFASYFEYIALENLVSREEADSWMEYAQSLAMEETGSVYVPEESAEDVYRVFDYGLSYKKGATLLHMIRYELNNDSLFFAILREYSHNFEDKVATAVDFRNELEQHSGIDFSCFFDQWYYGTGHPVFDIIGSVNMDTLYIECTQTTSTAGTPLFKMNFDLAVYTAEGEKIYRLYQEKNNQVFKIPVSDPVYDISFDPGKFLLAKSSVYLELATEQEYVLGPNPFNDQLILRLRNHIGNEVLRLHNLEGKLVLEETMNSNPFDLNLGNIEGGPYILTLEGGFYDITEKIIKVPE